MKATSKVIVILLTIGVMLNGLMYLSFDKGLAILSTKSAELINSWFYMLMFYFHVGFGSVALGSGVTQLIFTLKRMKPHRAIGNFYLVTVLFSGCGGLYISFYANTGFVAQLGFGVLAVLWLTTSYLAYSSVIRGNIDGHKKWILRSISLTFSAITLRLLLTGAIISGFTVEEVYPLVAWACWIPNLLVNEFIASQSGLRTT